VIAQNETVVITTSITPSTTMNQFLPIDTKISDVVGRCLRATKFLRLLKGLANIKKEWHDHAAYDERDAPAPRSDLGWRKQ
jgi:hypothetical protein